MALTERIQNGMQVENGLVERRDFISEATPQELQWEEWSDENADDAVRLHDYYMIDGANSWDVCDMIVALARNPHDRFAQKNLQYHARHIHDAREARLLQIGPTPARTVKCRHCGERTSAE